jgi:glycosyltransferase involved in cell wall biosynthesis
LIAGSGPKEQTLKDLAAKQSSNSRIRFLGQVNNVDELYQLSDIYVLSSDNEGLSLAFLEAMASGLICVATRCPGTTEVIDNGTNGFLVEKSTAGVLGGLRQALALPPQDRQRIAKNAVGFVSERFEIHKNVAKALTLLGIPQKKAAA